MATQLVSNPLLECLLAKAELPLHDKTFSALNKSEKVCVLTKHLNYLAVQYQKEAD